MAPTPGTYKGDYLMAANMGDDKQVPFRLDFNQ